MSLPIQGNFDFEIGTGNRTRFFTHVQPVIPFAIHESKSMMSRPLPPIIDGQSIALAWGCDSFGLGAGFLSYLRAPEILFPVQDPPPSRTTLRALDLWRTGQPSVGLRGRGGGLVYATFPQPFVSYINDTKATCEINVDSLCDWSCRQWNAPLNFVASQLVKTGGQPLRFSSGVRCPLETPYGGPEWGLRFAMSFLFPSG